MFCLEVKCRPEAEATRTGAKACWREVVDALLAKA